MTEEAQKYVNGSTPQITQNTLTPISDRTSRQVGLQYVIFYKMPINKKCFISRCGNTTNNFDKVQVLKRPVIQNTNVNQEAAV